MLRYDTNHLESLSPIIISVIKLLLIFRHKDAIRRPVFSAIVKMLSHSDSQLLSWNAKDMSIHTQVTCLGAPKEVASELYPELQDYYRNN